jgi:hypothetical protein
MEKPTTTTPVLVIIKSKQCPKCRLFEDRWAEISRKLRLVTPLRFFSIMCEDMSGKFDVTRAPRDCVRYATWFPTLFLVPGRVWDAAMSNLGPHSTALVRAGVQVFNGVETDTGISRIVEYNLSLTDDIVNWLKQAISNEKFRRAEIEGSDTILTPSIISTPSASFIDPEPSDENVCSFKLVPKYNWAHG